MKRLARENHVELSIWIGKKKKVWIQVRYTKGKHVPRVPGDVTYFLTDVRYVQGTRVNVEFTE